MSHTDRDLLRVLGEIAHELGHLREHMARVGAVQCKILELLERKHYPKSIDARIEVN